MTWCVLAERFGSGDGEREASMTRQMPYEPLPASVLLGVAGFWLLLGDVRSGEGVLSGKKAMAELGDCLEGERVIDLGRVPIEERLADEVAFRGVGVPLESVRRHKAEGDNAEVRCRKLSGENGIAKTDEMRGGNVEVGGHGDDVLAGNLMAGLRDGTLQVGTQRRDVGCAQKEVSQKGFMHRSFTGKG